MNAPRSRRKRKPAGDPAPRREPQTADPENNRLSVEDLQRSLGNAEFARLVSHDRQAHRAERKPPPSDSLVLGLLRRWTGARLQRQVTPAVDPPAPKKTAAVGVKLDLAPSSAVVIKTKTATLGDMEVSATARMALKGKASLIGEELPKRTGKKTQAQLLGERVRELLQKALNEATPGGNAMSIEVPLQADTLKLELDASAAKSAPFVVSGRFSTKGKSFSVTGCEVSKAAITLDASIWVSPKPPKEEKDKPAEQAQATDSIVKSLSFGGVSAGFASKRTATVVSKAMMDDFEKLPDVVKTHAFLKLPEQRAAFFQEMRAYFGTDEKTLAHFGKLQEVKGLKGSTTILHEEAAKRLLAVQAEIGQDKMPSSGGIGWPRSESAVGGEQTLANLHNLGFAIDYNATQAPHLGGKTDAEQKAGQLRRDLIQVVTGRSASLSFGSPKGIDTREMGTTMTFGTDEEKKKLEENSDVQKWLDAVESEAKSVGEASEAFRGSLKQKGDKGMEEDLGPKLVELRTKWLDAKSEEEKQEILAQVPAIIKPWLDKVTAQEAAMREKIAEAKLDITSLPSSAGSDTEVKSASSLLTRIDRFMKRVPKKALKLSKSQRTEAESLSGDARKFLSEEGSPPGSDEEAVDALKALRVKVSQRLDTRNKAIGQKQWLERMQALRPALADPVFLFGSEKKLAVKNPSAAQLVDVGFFNLRGNARAGAQAFGVEFVRSMVKHGFTHGGTWSNPDLMHFELRWQGPGKAK
jgi:hypothetical protein